MELRQLEYLVAVLDAESFTRAAERLHVAQPAVSASLRRLERELGAELVDRTGGVRATMVGADVAAAAREVLAAFERVRQVVDDHRGLLTGQVRIGAVGSVVDSRLPDLMSSFAREHPGVELRLDEGSGLDQLDDLVGGRLDVAFVGLLGDPPPTLGALVLHDEAMVVAVSEDDPLAHRRQVRLEELLHRRLILMPRGTAIRYGLDELFRTRGLEPDVAHVAGTPMLLGELAARGLGVGIVPESVLPYVHGLRGARIVRPTLRARRYLLWPERRPASPAAAAFLRHVRRGLAGD